MDGLLLNKKIDVVDFDGLKLLMFKNDNLYNNFIPDARKNQSLDAYYESVHENQTYPSPQINIANCESGENPKNGLFIFFKHLLDSDIDFSVFDIGSHVGDFALKCGHFFRDARKNIRVISFDPSPAGMLVPMNIEINGLEAYNQHENVAITKYDGIYIFKFVEGFSDSAKLSFSKKSKFFQKIIFYMGSSLRFKLKMIKKIFSYLFTRRKTTDLIVQGRSIAHYLKNDARHLFFKVDVEGYDEILVREIIRLKEKRYISLITELHVDADSLSFLNEVSEHFFVYDLFYCPNPTRFKKIEPDNFADFIQKDLKNREYGYTDLFLLDKTTPQVELLMLKLGKLKSMKDQMVL